MNGKFLLTPGASLLAAACLIVPAMAADDLPDATKKILAMLKLTPDIMAGIDEELVVPADWRAKAKAEDAVQILASWDPAQFKALSAPFRARYPDIQISYVRGGRYDRGVKPLMALKSGRFLSDVIISPGGDWVRYRQINALEDLRVLPNYKRLSKDMREPAGNWVGQKVAHRCMAYNTKKVKKSEMPKTWDDLVANPRWQGGKLGIPNRANLWLSMLWLAKGPKWTEDYLKKLFGTVKPQLRKEGANAMIALTVAGEFDATVAAAAYRLKQYQDKGAPIAFHCPSPVPVAISLLMVLKNNPHKYSSLIFTNWFLSKEGQIAQFAANNAIPVREDLAQRREFMPYPEEIIGKPLAIRDEGALRTEYPKLLAVYDPLWKAAGGPVEGKNLGKTIKVTLTGVKRGGRVISFKLKGKDETAMISGRRTAVFLNGKSADRKTLKAGMSCDVTYPGKGGRASKVACKQ